MPRLMLWGGESALRWKKRAPSRSRACREPDGLAPPSVSVACEPSLLLFYLQMAAPTPSREDLVSCYQILGLQPGASLDAVRRAYKRLVRLWHPDQYMHDESMRRTAERHMKLINTAHKTLVGFLDFRPPFRFRDEQRASPREDPRRGRGGGTLSRFRARTKAWWQWVRFSFEEPEFFGPSMKTFVKTMSYGLAGYAIFIGFTYVLGLASNVLPANVLTFIGDHVYVGVWATSAAWLLLDARQDN